MNSRDTIRSATVPNQMPEQISIFFLRQSNAELFGELSKFK